MPAEVSTNPQVQQRQEEEEDDKTRNDDSGTTLTTHKLPSENSPLFGAFVITVVLWCMVLGPLLPLLFLLLLYFGCMQLASTLAALAVASMAVAGHSPRWCRFYLKAASYFQQGVYLHMEQRVLPLLQHTPSMWCMHPHGTALGFGFTLNGAVRFRAHDYLDLYVPTKVRAVLTTARMQSCNGVMAPVLFWIPLLRSLLLGFGCCTPASKAGMHGLLQRRLDFGILPGGMEEVALYTRGRERVYLKHRAGFIKYALQYGYLLLPAYTFGECDLYDSMTTGKAVRMWMLKHHGFVIPVFWGPNWYAPWLPRRTVALHTVIGAPLALPQIENPTTEDVQKWHGKYMEALIEIFERHKEELGYGDRVLEVM